MRPLAGLALAVLLGAAACGDGVATSTPPATAADPTASPSRSLAPGPIALTLQLSWPRGAAAAGYIAAIEQGFYEAAGLDVTIVDGGPEVESHVLAAAPDGPEFTVAWLPRMLVARDGGATDLVNIAQVFQRSGTLSVSWRGTDVTGPEGFLGKRVEIRDFGDGAEVLAAARMAGLDPETDFRTSIGGVEPASLLARQVDVAQTTLYDGYARILETTDPRTGSLYRPDDLNVINYRDEGTAMLQDGIYARAAWLAEPGNDDVARRFLTASFEGWIHCRDHAGECVSAVMDAGATAGAGHLAWGINEVNGLIWPSPAGIGVMDPALWEHTVEVALGAGIIAAAPDDTAYRSDLAGAAVASIATLDVQGRSFVRGSVEITPGGE